MKKLRKCINCGSEAEIKTEVYPNTKYKMYRICCKSCFARTQAKRKLDVAIREWNNPYSVKLNSQSEAIVNKALPPEVLSATKGVIRTALPTHPTRNYVGFLRRLNDTLDKSFMDYSTFNSSWIFLVFAV